jgi:transcriptional regulator with XRE-family HTH domain
LWTYAAKSSDIKLAKTSILVGFCGECDGAAGWLSEGGFGAVEFALFIKHRLRELGLEQRELAAAASVTESYVSQLLTGKKAPPAPERTDIYETLDALLKLSRGQLAKLAAVQRDQAARTRRAEPPAPLFTHVREAVLDACDSRESAVLRALFEKDPFSPLERLVTQTLLDVVKGVVRTGLTDRAWLRRVSRASGRRYEQTRVEVLEFLETDIFNLSPAQCVQFLRPLLDRWTIDLSTWAMDVALNPHLAPSEPPRRFAFVERQPAAHAAEEPGLLAFLKDPALSGSVTPEELAFLRRLAVGPRRPTALYYYRELQNLRDPLHFRAS